VAAAPTLQQLSYFVAAVEHGSFVAAAEAVHIAQPSLSEQIRRLERSLGVTLFVRTNRRLQLTEAGRVLLPQARRTLADLSSLRESVRHIQELSGGTVSFGTFSSAHLYLLTALVGDFRAQYPGVTTRVVGLNSSEVADQVRRGELEAGLVQLPIDERGLDVGPPVLVDSVVYVSTDGERTRAPVTIEQLAAAPLILSEARWGAEDPLRRSLTDRARRAGVALQPQIEVEFQTAAVELAAHGLGDSLVSYLVTRWPGYPGRLHWVPLDPPVVERFAFITRTNGVLSPATRIFMDLAHRHVRALQRAADAGPPRGDDGGVPPAQP
jgi:DNA-binding transcriptional LysR family regulator